MLKTVIWLNVGLRALMETGVVAGFAVWGYSVGSNIWSSLALALAVPAAGFGIWGLIDFRSAGSGAEMLRLAEELLISGLPPWHSIASGSIRSAGCSLPSPSSITRLSI